MPFIIKVKFEEDTRRLTLEDVPSFEGVLSAVKSMFPNLPNTFFVKYVDEDEDTVTISSDMELSEAIRIASPNNLLRLLLIAKSETNNVQAEQTPLTNFNSNPLFNLPSLSQLLNDPIAGQRWLETLIGSPSVNQSNPTTQANPKPNDIPDLVSLFEHMGIGNAQQTMESQQEQAKQEAQQNIQQLIQRLISSPYIQQLLPQLLLFAPQLIPVINSFLPSNTQLNEIKSETKKEEEAIHYGVVCDMCETSITGVRYKCTTCVNYDLCARCEAKPNSHDPAHVLLKIQKPGSHHNTAYGRGCPYNRPRNVNNNNDFHKRSKSPVKRTAQQSGLLSRFVQDVTIPDGTAMNPGQQFVKIWKLRNEGEIAWPEGTYLEFVGGDKLAVQKEVSVPAITAGNEVDIAVDMSAPTKPGRYVSYWRLCNADGSRFGQRVWIEIFVQNETKDAELVADKAVVPPTSQSTQTQQMGSMEVETQTGALEQSNKETATTTLMNTNVGTSMEEKQTKDIGVDSTCDPMITPQVQSLLDMGFEDQDKLQLLVDKHSGDLVAVVQELLLMK